MDGIAKLISASAWALVALMLAGGIPFAWRKLLAWLDAKSQAAMADAVRKMIDE
jgi:threonine/homoserine/homoserine lactone efflux protein